MQVSRGVAVACFIVACLLPAVGFYICSIGPALRSLPSTSGANFLVPADSSNGGGGRDERRVAELLLDRLDRLEQEKKSSVDAAAAGYIPDVPVLDTAPKSLPLEDPGPTSNEPEWLGRLRNGFGSTANSRPAAGSPRAPSEFQTSISSYIFNDASPAEQSLMHRARKLIESMGLASAQTLLDSVAMPGEGEMHLECGKENGMCLITPGCADKSGIVTVIYGANPANPKTYLSKQFQDGIKQIKCSTQQFGVKDPAFGQIKKCWVKCAKGDGSPIKVEQCSEIPGKTVGVGKTEWAGLPLCVPKGAGYSLSTHEAAMQEAFAPFCTKKARKDLMNAFLNCNFRAAFRTFTQQQPGTIVPANKAEAPKWIEKAWVTFFKGSAKGLSHSMMVSNLIRSVHLFSKYPIIVYAVGVEELSVDWDPKVFPRLIVIQADGITDLYRAPQGVSFNFEKFRSMMLRIKIGVQLDADMINGPNCDKLFDATEREVTADYPFPIMPVHWMSRYKGKKGETIDGYPMYSIGYPGDNGNKHFPDRIRWAHAHPTWTYHALPFITDALLAKLDFVAWSNLPRVVKAIGSTPEQNPSVYMREDEDMLNILLWRYKKHKQWCKWDLEPTIYHNFVDGSNRLEDMKDTRWYPEGVPLILLSMHNTKNTIETDGLLQKILKRGVTGEKYIYWKGKYFNSPESFKKEFGANFNAPCVLV